MHCRHTHPCSTNATHLQHTHTPPPRPPLTLAIFLLSPPLTTYTTQPLAPCMDPWVCPCSPLLRARLRCHLSSL